MGYFTRIVDIPHVKVLKRNHLKKIIQKDILSSNTMLNKSEIDDITKKEHIENIKAKYN